MTTDLIDGVAMLFGLLLIIPACMHDQPSRPSGTWIIWLAVKKEKPAVEAGLMDQLHHTTAPLVIVRQQRQAREVHP